MDRVVKIEVFKNYAIQRIVLKYESGQEWSVGNKSGIKDEKVVILAEHEHLVKVRHERLKMNWSVGAMVEFTTNAGRIFKYSSEATSDEENEIDTYEAAANHQIQCLKITNGCLEGVTQTYWPDQLLSAKSSWYCLLMSTAAGCMQVNTSCHSQLLKTRTPSSFFFSE